MRYVCSVVILFLLQLPVFGQLTVPAPKQEGGVVILHAKAHLGNGQVIEDAAVAFREGAITFVGPAADWRGSADFRVIEARGKHLYPGFIAANTSLGLNEIELVRATRDEREVGELNPNVRALIAYNTDSEVIPTIRSNGVLLAQIVPQGGTVAGQSSVVQLDAWNWEDAAYRTDGGIHVYWPRATRFGFQEAGADNTNRYAEELAGLELLFREAEAYAKTKEHQPENLKLEAMRGLFSGEKTLFVHANDAKDIQRAVLLGEQFGLRTVIVGGRDAWMIAAFLKEKQAAVVLQKTQSLPGREDEAVDQPFRTPSQLKEAGVLFCISAEAFWQQRNLPFQAGQAAGHGLDREAAVQAITLDAARILGIDQTTGSIEKGKDATLFLSTGDALDMRSSIVETAFIQGRQIDLDDKHKALYKKYQAKYQVKD
ncbi:MAG: amidohydrolase family protein [Saprospirales bacterium]|nr:amidohydrolase family protein [Saprospirales bacterium]MBK7335999.1 amidohydrolase family protein [Saprospirales bacterium]